MVFGIRRPITVGIQAPVDVHRETRIGARTKIAICGNPKIIDLVIAVARQLGVEFADVYVPLDGIFRVASDGVDPAHWAADAIHPTPAGHALIADAWVKAVEAG